MPVEFHRYPFQSRVRIHERATDQAICVLFHQVHMWSIRAVMLSRLLRLFARTQVCKATQSEVEQVLDNSYCALLRGWQPLRE